MPSLLRSTRAYSSRKLTHLDDQGRASMVDVSSKTPTKRTATASGRIVIPKVAYDLVTATYPASSPSHESSEAPLPAFEKARRKGDALTVAQLAGIMGAKQTPNLIPLCHPLSLSKIDVRLTLQVQAFSSEETKAFQGVQQENEVYSILCTASATCEGKTGVEMEALTGVSVALLTVWDMLKAVAGKEMEIGQIVVESKEGGKSGDFQRTRTH